MDISGVGMKPVNMQPPAQRGVQAAPNAPNSVAKSAAAPPRAAADASAGENGKDAPVKEPRKELSKDEVGKMTDELNYLMQEINSEIKFTMHEKSKRLMVQVVDPRDGEVLKEFPPHQLLDTLANISEYIGLLLDKKV